MFDEIKSEAAALSGRMSDWRRGFHRRPETANNERETSAALKAFFERLGIPVRTLAGTGLRADLEGLPGGRTVALRADMDALPLDEEGDTRKRRVLQAAVLWRSLAQMLTDDPVRGALHAQMRVLLARD